MLHPYLKQEITQKNLFYLHLMKEAGAVNGIVVLQSLHTHYLITCTSMVRFSLISTLLYLAL